MVSENGKRLFTRALLGAAAIVTVALAGGAASSARADGWYGDRDDHRAYARRDWDGDRGRDAWRWRAERREEWREHHPYGYGYGYSYAPAPTYYYAQPRVYYAPQPYFYPGSFNITIPIR